jgi:pyrimidine operon attenuation protein/uracil phosphoribosyltransferase
MTGLHDEEIEDLRLFAENRLLSRDITKYEHDLVQRTIVALTYHDRVTESRIASMTHQIAALRIQVATLEIALYRRDMWRRLFCIFW